MYLPLVGWQVQHRLSCWVKEGMACGGMGDGVHGWPGGWVADAFIGAWRGVVGLG